MTKATQKVEGGEGTLPVDGITGPEFISNIRYKIFKIFQVSYNISGLKYYFMSYIGQYAAFINQASPI